MADTKPTLAGFEAFCRAQGFDSAVIPDDDPGFDIAFNIALEWVPHALRAAGCTLYTYTVYKWGVSVLIADQQDQGGQTFFTDLRTKFRTDNFVPGVISSAADSSTSETLTVGTALSNLPIEVLARVTDPWGRSAVGACMSMGPLWGLS